MIYFNHYSKILKKFVMLNLQLDNYFYFPFILNNDDFLLSLFLAKKKENKDNFYSFCFQVLI